MGRDRGRRRRVPPVGLPTSGNREHRGAFSDARQPWAYALPPSTSPLSIPCDGLGMRRRTTAARDFPRIHSSLSALKKGSMSYDRTSDFRHPKMSFAYLSLKRFMAFRRPSSCFVVRRCSLPAVGSTCNTRMVLRFRSQISPDSSFKCWFAGLCNWRYGQFTNEACPKFYASSNITECHSHFQDSML